ncbi:MAG: hypothetical protein M1826_003973 [Phylliscum demangeonii]|nr:MAG: hypothetical protein M1826_003973 [Phylliscum demangeonii]
MPPSLNSIASIRSYLQATYAAPLLPPQHAHEPALSHAIASLSAHPAIEAGLHLLNADLPSAHFLVRHMQAAPAHEGMLLHGILHRIEGDYDNARAWYGDVSGSDVFARAWPGAAGLEEARAWIGAVEALAQKNGRAEERAASEQRSRREIDAVLDWCLETFGAGRWEDATKVWVRPGEKIQAMGTDMVSGEKGWRQF